MMGNKHTKNQHKLRNRLYRKVSHRAGGTYRSRKARREWADAEDFRTGANQQ